MSKREAQLLYEAMKKIALHKRENGYWRGRRALTSSDAYKFRHIAEKAIREANELKTFGEVE